MNALLLKANWNIAKGKLRQTVARLAEDAIEFTDGKQDELLGRIKRRTALGAVDRETELPGCASGPCRKP